MQQRSNRGFTLVEVMIVVAIIGILATMGLPFYRDYTIRAQVSEGLSMAGASRTAVTQTYMESGEWPVDNGAAGIGDPSEITGKYVARVEVVDGTIEVTFGGEANAAIVGKTLSLEPSENDDGGVVWNCGSAPGGNGMNARGTNDGAPDTSLPNEYLPDVCRS